MESKAVFFAWLSRKIVRCMIYRAFLRPTMMISRLGHGNWHHLFWGGGFLPFTLRQPFNGENHRINQSLEDEQGLTL